MRIRDVLGARAPRLPGTPRVAPATDMGLTELGNRLERITDRVRAEDRQVMNEKELEARQARRDFELEQRQERREAELEAKRVTENARREAEDLEIFNRSAGLRERWSTSGREALDSGAAGTGGWLGEFRSGMEADIEAALEDAPEELRPRLEMQLRRDSEIVVNSFAEPATRQRAAQAVEEGSVTLDALVNATRQNPTMLADNLEAVDAFIGTLDAPQDVKERLAREYRSRVVEAALQRRIEQNPSTVLTEIREGKYNDVLQPDELERAADQASSEVARREEEARQQRAREQALREQAEHNRRVEANQAAALAEQRAAYARAAQAPVISARVDSNLMSLAQTGVAARDAPSVAEVERVLGPGPATQYRLDMEAAQSVGRVLGRADLRTSADLTRTVQSLRPQPGQANFAGQQRVYETASGAASSILQQRRQDPVSYWRGTPLYRDTVREIRRRAPGLSDAQVDQEALRQLQVRDGVPASGVRLMTNQRAAQVGAQLTNPQTAAATVASIDRTFGPRAAPQILFEASQTADGRTAQSARALATVPAGQRAGAAELLFAPGPAPTVRRETQQAVDAELRPLRSTLVTGSGTSANFADVSAAAGVMAARLEGQGMSREEAARTAAGMFSGQYDFRAGVRIPRTGGVAPSDVQSGAASTRLFILGNPALVAPRGGPPGQTQAQRQAAYASELRRSSRWVNLADDSGLMLVDANGRPVVLANGQLATFTWSQLQQGGTSERGQSNIRQRATAGAAGGN